MHKLMTARYDDICMKCAGIIKAGDLIMWEKKNSHHAECDTGVVGRWLKSNAERRG